MREGLRKVEGPISGTAAAHMSGGCCCFRTCWRDEGAAACREAVAPRSRDTPQGEGVRRDLSLGGNRLKGIMETQWPAYDLQTARVLKGQRKGNKVREKRVVEDTGSYILTGFIY